MRHHSGVEDAQSVMFSSQHCAMNILFQAPGFMSTVLLSEAL
jgi:hypothetical protein